MQPHEAALHAAQAAQSAAIESRDALHTVQRLLERQVRVPDERSYQLGLPGGITDAPSVDDWGAGTPCLSTAFVNFDPAVAFNVGYGGRSPRVNAGAIVIPARRVMVIPWIVGIVELDVEPGQAYPTGGLNCAVVRFNTVQQFAAVQI